MRKRLWEDGTVPTHCGAVRCWAGGGLATMEKDQEG